MEALGAVLAVLFLYGLYHVIRAGVRDGIREAFKDRAISVDDKEADR